MIRVRIDYTGPAAADGVAVAADATGAMAGYDIRTGRALWSTQLLAPPSGPLVAVGDRVLYMMTGDPASLAAEIS